MDDVSPLDSGTLQALQLQLIFVSSLTLTRMRRSTGAARDPACVRKAGGVQGL